MGVLLLTLAGALLLLSLSILSLSFLFRDVFRAVTSFFGVLLFFVFAVADETGFEVFCFSVFLQVEKHLEKMIKLIRAQIYN